MNNTRIIKELNMKESTFYAMKRRKPRMIDLVEKGILYEDFLKNASKIFKEIKSE